MPILNYKGEDGQFHSLGGLLKGDPGNAGVVIGDTEPTDPNVKVWINSAGDPMTAEQIPVSSTDNSSVATALGNKVPSSRTINGKPLNSDVVLSASDLEGAAADSNKLGGKDPKYYIQPYNLLDNSDFRNPVMQTGFNGMHGTIQYIVDRWQRTGGINAVQASDGIILTSESINARARQIIVSSNLVGKPVTLAVYKTDGGVCCPSAVVPTTISNNSFLWFENNELILALTCITEDLMNVDIATQNAISVSIKAVALYEGTFTADTIPPYVPKGYAAELAECRRYYQVYREIFYDIDLGTDQHIPFFYPVPTRTETPTVNVEADAWVNDAFVRDSNISITVTSTAARIFVRGYSGIYRINLTINDDL